MKKMLESESHDSETSSKLMQVGNDNQWLLKYYVKSEWEYVFSTSSFEKISNSKAVRISVKMMSFPILFTNC